MTYMKEKVFLAFALLVLFFSLIITVLNYYIYIKYSAKVLDQITEINTQLEEWEAE